MPGTQDRQIYPALGVDLTVYGDTIRVRGSTGNVSVNESNVKQAIITAICGSVLCKTNQKYV